MEVKTIGEAVRVAKQLFLSVRAGPKINAWGEETYIVEVPRIPFRYVYCKFYHDRYGWIK